MHPSYTFTDKRICVNSGEQNSTQLSFVNIRNLGDGLQDVAFIFPSAKAGGAHVSTQSLNANLYAAMESIPGVLAPTGVQVESPPNYDGTSFYLYDLLTEEGLEAYREYTNIQPGSPLDSRLLQKIELLESLKDQLPDGLSGADIQMACMFYAAKHLGIIERATMNTLLVDIVEIPEDMLSAVLEGMEEQNFLPRLEASATTPPKEQIDIHPK